MPTLSKSSTGSLSTMVVTLTGNNTFAMRRRLNELTAEFVKKYGELALEQLDAEETEAQNILDAAASLPFLAARKMVVVRSPGNNQELADQIEQLISSIGPTTDLILYEPEPDRRRVYFKKLKSHSQFEDFNELDAHGLAKWLVDEAQKQKAKLSLADANFLVGRVGANQELLYNELQKLITYNPQITRQNIELLAEPTPQGKIFDLLDAAFGGQKKRALQLYEEQRAQKVEPEAILPMIAWQLQMIALVKLGEGFSTSKIAKDKGMNIYPVTKAAGLAKKLSKHRLEILAQEALEIDRKNKTSALDLDEALKTYIATI